MIGDQDWSAVGDLLVGVGHQHAPCSSLHVCLSVVIAFTQTPEN